MRATSALKMSVQDEWDAATNHQFCRELAAGTLPLDKVRWYLVQDYKFIEQFVRLLATSIAHAPTLADGVPSAQFLGLVTSTENTYFQRCFEALEITQADREAPAAPATEDFLALMVEARMSNRYEKMLAVLVVAEWSYLTWAEQYEDYDPKLPFWFAEWIDLHSGNGFADVVEHLRNQLDSIWDGLSDQQQRSAGSMFQRAVACERSFFDEAYSSC